MATRYLHTMIRVSDLEKTLEFFCDLLGLQESHRMESESGRFTLVYLYAPYDEALAISQHAPILELTYNWDSEDYTGGRNFGHLAYEVDDIYAVCQKCLNAGVIINRPPRDGRMAFVKTPDQISIEFLQKGDALPPCEPWISMVNTGHW